MRLETRKLIDKSFSGLGVMSILIMAAALLIILVPIFVRGTGAIIFRGTVEHRRLLLDKFGRGDRSVVMREVDTAREARRPMYEMIDSFEEEINSMSGARKREYKRAFKDVKIFVHELFGPCPGEETPVLVRKQYGQTRWNRTKVKLHHLMFVETWDYSDPDAMGRKVLKPRVDEFKGTSFEPFFGYVENNIEKMLLPRWTFYAGFFVDSPLDIHIFGGIFPELLGTFYLTLGAMLVALPLGVIAAIYLTEYSRPGKMLTLLRTCISTLAGVPSIVFGLFGLAFFINAMHVSPSKSVIAGSLTLGLLVLPTVIRASEEAIRSVPQAYREAALSLGAGQWHTIVSVILPAALPGILTGVVISMGRAAGETAPIIFTAAVSVGKALKPWEAINQGTPALSWNIYNLCTEHEAVDEIRHVQFGMVMTLVLVVLVLNISAIILRARVSKKLKG